MGLARPRGREGCPGTDPPENTAGRQHSTRRSETQEPFEQRTRSDVSLSEVALAAAGRVPGGSRCEGGTWTGKGAARREAPGSGGNVGTLAGGRQCPSPRHTAGWGAGPRSQPLTSCSHPILCDQSLQVKRRQQEKRANQRCPQTPRTCAAGSPGGHGQHLQHTESPRLCCGGGRARPRTQLSASGAWNQEEARAGQEAQGHLPTVV